MARLPYAARKFIEQVGHELGSEPEVEFHDEDGFRVYRTVRFDKEVGEQIEAALAYVDDERITGHYVTDAGYLYVRFSTGNEADDRSAFLLRDAFLVAREESRGAESEPEVPEVEAPRKTRKKAKPQPSGDDEE